VYQVVLKARGKRRRERREIASSERNGMKLDSVGHALVTGGASGIGLAIAQALAARRIKVTIADIDRENLDTVLAAGTAGVRGAILDVRDRDAWATVKAEAEAEFGPVDLLFNNAGISSFGYDIADMDPAAFDRIVAVNLTGVFNGIHAFAADMRRRGKGHIVNTSSMAGICGPGLAVGGSYAAAKFGVVGLSETLQWELAPHGVNVSILCPGQTITGIAQNSAKLGGDMRMPDTFDQISAAAGQRETGSAEDLASKVMTDVEADALYIIAHGQGWWPSAEKRHDELKEAFAGMR
jgi:NAD(P)-dependent dehydrogenase (short-subunit alcohol dehydrogenase family)